MIQPSFPESSVGRIQAQNPQHLCHGESNDSANETPHEHMGRSYLT